MKQRIFGTLLTKTQKEEPSHDTMVDHSMQHLQAVLNTVIDGIITIDAKGTILSFNPAAEKILGYHTDEVIGRNVHIFMPDPYYQEHDQYIANYLNTGTAKIIGIGREVEARRRDGSLFPMELSISEMDLDGQTCFVGIIRDISERKQAEEALNNLTERLQAVLDTVVEGIITIDEHGYIESFNPAAETMFGYTHEEIQGKNIKMLMPEPYRREHDGYLKNYKESGSPKVIGIGREVQAQHRNGHIFDIELEVGAMHISGKKKFVGTVRDISKRRAKEASDRLLKSIIISSADAIISKTLDGFITSWNQGASQLFGYSEQEVVGKHITLLFPPELFDEERRIISDISQGKTISNYDTIRRSKAGKDIEVSATISPIYDEPGNIIGAANVIRDNTVRKASERTLEEYAKKLESANEDAQKANQLKSEFLASMSHEIRTPMNGVVGMTELLLESKLNPKQHARAEAILTSAENLMVIINDILDFSKIESGKLDIEHIPFNLLHVAEDIAEFFSGKAAEKNIELLLRYHPKLPHHVIGDPVRIRQIISNFVSNAIKFTKEGYILINLEPEYRDNDHSHHLCFKVSVEDTGIGIPEDKQEHIFDKFTQADGSTTREFGGTGLGLAICSQLAEMMHGTVGVESVLDKGSTFWFTMILGVAEGEAHEPIPTIHIPEGLNILIVDDLEINRKILKEQLLGHQMQVTVCEDGNAALQAMNEANQALKPFDIALLDYMMPGMDGIALAQGIRNHSVFDHTKLIMLTSAGEKGFAKRFEQVGFDAYLAKPLRNADLLDVISMIWSARNSNQSLGIINAHTLAACRHHYAKGSATDDISFRNTHILLVEDNRINQALAEEIVQNLGCTISIAENGRIALDMVTEEEYDLVLMDCQMPVMDGFEASRQLRAMKQKGDIADIPIIALTANAMKGDKEKCMNAGMQDYITKPVRKENLQEVLQTWLPEEKCHFTEIVAFEENISQDTMTTSTSHNPKEIFMSNNFDITAMDMEELEGAKALLKKRFPEMIEGYLEDANIYVKGVEEGLDDHDLDKIAKNAHPLKSSSAGLGISGVSEVAKAIEGLAKNGEPIETIQSFFEPLKEALAYATPKLRAMLDEAA